MGLRAPEGFSQDGGEPIYMEREGCAMRCGCPECGAYMAHAEGARVGCVCPECGYRCTACLGTNSLLSREALAALREDRALAEQVAETILRADGAQDDGTPA